MRSCAARSGTAARARCRGDRSRIVRALEVVEATGRSLADWHRDGMPPVVDPGARDQDVSRRRSAHELYRRIDARFDAMLAAGALEEVRALAARDLDPLLPAMKAHGVPWLRRHLRGEISLREAAESGKRTPAATPSGRSPGSATRCRDGLGRSRRRRGCGAFMADRRPAATPGERGSEALDDTSETPIARKPRGQSWASSKPWSHRPMDSLGRA